MACNYDTKYGEMGQESKWQDVFPVITIDSIEPIFL